MPFTPELAELIAEGAQQIETGNPHVEIVVIIGICLSLGFIGLASAISYYFFGGKELSKNLE